MTTQDEIENRIAHLLLDLGALERQLPIYDMLVMEIKSKVEKLAEYATHQPAWAVGA